MSISPHQAYRACDVEWLPFVPEHWQVVRLKNLIQETDERAGECQAELLGLSKSIGVVSRSQLEQGAAESNDYGKYKLVHPGQLVMNKMQAWNGVFGLSRQFGKVSPDYATFRFSEQKLGHYLTLMFRTDVMAGVFFTRCRGMGTAFLRLNTGDFLDIKIPLPPVSEVKAIVTFLDRETGKIDALIAEQEKLLTLLAEKRQATISHAVTRGLNPKIPMKDSGVAWLGKVPAHWEVVPLKYLVAFRSGGTPNKENSDFWNGDIPWASAKDLKTDVLDDTIDHLTHLALESGVATLLPAGVVVVLVRGMMLARVFPVCEISVPMTINQDLKALIPGPRVEGPFLAWLLRGTADETLNRLDEAGHGTKALRMDAWTSMKLAVPPLDEQKRISAYLRSVTTAVDDLARQVQASITILQERRAALISAAVTGKIDVRSTTAEDLAA